jgi:hypothetical protein
LGVYGLEGRQRTAAHLEQEREEMMLRRIVVGLVAGVVFLILDPSSM